MKPNKTYGILKDAGFKSLNALNENSNIVGVEDYLAIFATADNAYLTAGDTIIITSTTYFDALATLEIMPGCGFCLKAMQTLGKIIGLNLIKLELREEPPAPQLRHYDGRVLVGAKPEHIMKTFLGL